MRRLRALVAAVLCAGAAANAVAAQGEPQWRGTTYSVPATRAPLGNVLIDLTRAIGMEVHATRRAAAVPALLDAQPPVGIVTFLDSLSQRYRMDWFVFRGTLYASLASESAELRLDVPQARQPELRAYLDSLKLLDDRFVWLPLASSNLVLVEGPPEYLRLVRQHTQRLQELADAGLAPGKTPPVAPAPEELQTMVFRLRHATAADRAPGDPDGDGLTTQPGVATQLLAVMGGAAGSATPMQLTLDAGRRMTALRQAAGPNPGAALVGADLNLPAEADTRSLAATAVPQAMPIASGTSARIAADPRTNSVLVRDRPSLRPQYEQLIAALDLPLPMLGLDAMVLDLPQAGARALLAAAPGSAASAPLLAASGAARVLSIPDALTLLAGVQALRTTDTEVDVATHGILFRQGSAFTLDFRDARLFPRYSVPFWDAWLRYLFRLPEGQDRLERVMALKITGSARVQDGGQVALQMDLSDERSDPLMADKTVDQRSTRLRAGADVRSDEVLVLVASTHAAGRENGTERVRLVLLSARCLRCEAR